MLFIRCTQTGSRICKMRGSNKVRLKALLDVFCVRGEKEITAEHGERHRMLDPGNIIENQ
jgi:hypothetical protein